MTLARLSFVIVLAALVAVPEAAGKSKLFYEDTLPAHGNGTVTVTARAPASFKELTVRW